MADAEAVSMAQLAGIDHIAFIAQALVKLGEVNVGVIGIIERRDDIPSFFLVQIWPETHFLHRVEGDGVVLAVAVSTR